MARPDVRASEIAAAGRGPWREPSFVMRRVEGTGTREVRRRGGMGGGDGEREERGERGGRGEW